MLFNPFPNSIFLVENPRISELEVKIVAIGARSPVMLFMELL